MDALQLITKKQSGNALSKQEIEFLIRNYTSGDIPDYQMAAFLMAVYYQEMTLDETVYLTQAMLESGETLDTSSIPAVKIDKHSTGGVGDKVSIILAPLVASLGIYVPMISGRALGHSGGTLDKLDSIPGFKTNLTVSDSLKKLSKAGAVFMAQTDRLVPADKKIYALRDCTSTVKSVPLITASILSKKIAEGIDALVLDVKIGKGAFFKDQKYGLKLADMLLAASSQLNLNTAVLFTDMDQPLGNAVGNWLEIRECIDTLKGQGPDDLIAVTLALGTEMLVRSRIEKQYDRAYQLVSQKLKSGAAYDKFIELVKLQGGKIKFIEQPQNYPSSRYEYIVRSERSGYINELDALHIAELAMNAGAGRKKMADTIDPKAGILINKKIGDFVERGEELLAVYSDLQLSQSEINRIVRNAYFITKIKGEKPNPVLGYAAKEGMCKWPPY